jgi:hypothetical protein
MRREKTRDGLIEKALDDIAATDKPSGAKPDRAARERRRAILEQLLQDALLA